MAGISKRVWIFLVATSGMAPLVHASEPSPVHYDIGLDVKQGEVEAITVRATVRTGDDGVIDFDPPKQRPDEVHAERGQLDTSAPERWRVRAAPGTDVVLTWRSPKPELVSSPSWTPFEKVIARPGAVFAFGGIFLAMPKGAATRQATTAIVLPPGWQASCGMANGPLSVTELPSASLLASRNIATTTRRIGATTTLHVGSIGSRQQEVDEIATRLASALNAFSSRATLRKAESSDSASGPINLTLNVLILGAGDGWASNAQGPSANVFLPRDDPSRPWLFEVMTNMADADGTPGNPTNAWFARGVNGYRIANALRAEGDFDNVAFARHMDLTLRAYGGSPLRRAPNAQVAEDYDRIVEMHDLPAARGELFAWLVDGQMREATQGRKGLTVALRRMDAQSAHPGPDLIAAVAAEGGGDITPLYRRYIVDGELLQLPRDALGSCFSIGTVADVDGWQVQHVFARPPAHCAAPAPVGADSSAMSPRHG